MQKMAAMGFGGTKGREVASMSIVEEYAENGYIVIRNAINQAELIELRSECDAVIERVKRAKEGHSFLWGGEWLSSQDRQSLDINGVHDTQFHSAAFARLLVNCDAVLDTIEQLIGPNIQLHHPKLIVKPPETGAPFPMHQDAPYFPHKNQVANCITFKGYSLTDGSLLVHIDAPSNAFSLRIKSSIKCGIIATKSSGAGHTTRSFPLNSSSDFADDGRLSG
jgi:ectoine hydroxylase-related dioxygenase (phytanoyl-CoA dioxygenase family)